MSEASQTPRRDDESVVSPGKLDFFYAHIKKFLIIYTNLYLLNLFES